VNRILVTYGGREYTVGNRSLDDVEAEIAAGIDSGKAAWLDVNYGAGTPRPCRLLLAPGVPIALVDFPHEPEVQPPQSAE
jgi:hypothetical protein